MTKKVILTSVLVIWTVICVAMSVSMIRNNAGIGFPVWLHLVLLIAFLSTGLVDIKRKSYVWSIILFEGVLLVCISLLIIIF
ncbi:hypothetical protein KKC_03864 [Listeria fleischmannii subsp. coloradonensis]|uniref:Uncharacterized protein n=1 Tax=Listeria fleischmannii TaxID=1069827 RepID=A0A841YBF4_9LIST|nr:hypothetical protein KKC_03864 [Listeria fleischmannii subsp. coloradonensis]MBC1397590.1 hypothetical protein [Listeria fleischmannii]MBC1418273.1 hypothetical protein [Listeria fleischmannii]MBC1425959.1 hypothetical protein [Listeria fleischmannii]STY35016.1 Uncharacterised protein [Listeria fleischmannii subsp. coloradonensis]